MKYLVMLGSDFYFGTNGILTIEENGKRTEFFKIREIFKVRSDGSYLAVDCDIKDKDKVREVKLAKNRPVCIGENLKITSEKNIVVVKRADESEVIKIEQIELDNTPIIEFEPLKKRLSQYSEMQMQYLLPTLNKITIDAAIRITGDFNVGNISIKLTEGISKINGLNIMGNLFIGGNGICISSNGSNSIG